MFTAREPDARKLISPAKYLLNVPRTSEMCRFCSGKLRGELENSLRPLQNALMHRVHMRYARHRSPCVRMLTAQLEAIRPSSTRTDAAAMGRSRPCGDVEPCNARAPVTLQIDAVEPTAARKPHPHLGISKLLRHRSTRPTQGSGSDAQETAWSKLPGSGHDIRPGECARGGTRWPTAHRLSEHRPTHARALLTAC